MYFFIFLIKSCLLKIFIFIFIYFCLFYFNNETFNDVFPFYSNKNFKEDKLLFNEKSF